MRVIIVLKVIVMRPRIGIVARPMMFEDYPRWYVTDSYRKACILSGGNPFMILPVQMSEYNTVKISEMERMSDEEKYMLSEQLSLCDGIVMPGGKRMFEHDFFILEYAIKNDIPILGICLGMQVMANYGRVPNNIKIENKNNHDLEEENYVHEVIIDRESNLYNILCKERFMVNSLHSMEIQESELYRTVAFSDDGVIEAVELPGARFNVGLQWHPEIMYSYDETGRLIWNKFIECSKERIAVKNS